LITQALLVLCLASNVVVIGPGALSKANPGVLERVAETRLHYGYGLYDENPHLYDALVAPPACNLLGYDGWLVTNGEMLRVLVVDCGGPDNKMIENGLLADINKPHLVHKQGWMVLRP
jgi:hypothetical protein